MTRDVFVTVPKEGFSYDGAVKPRLDFGYFANNRMGTHTLPIDMYTGKSHLESNSADISSMSKGSIVFYQIPTYTSVENELDFIKKARRKAIIVVGLVHDVDFLRFGGDKKDTLSVLQACSLLILPSDRMYNELVASGLKHTFYELQGSPWDYRTPITSSAIGSYLTTRRSQVVNYAGNLVENKAGFVDELIDIGVDLKVFGQVEPWMSRLPSSVVQGPKNADEELIKAMNEGYGLVWAGGASDDVSYNSYEYYNWQYKLSAYLAAGVVPIARKGTHVGDWINRKAIGITVDNLEEIPAAIEKTDIITYNQYLSRAKFTRMMVTNGGTAARTIMDVYDWVRLYYGKN